MFSPMQMQPQPMFVRGFPGVQPSLPPGAFPGFSPMQTIAGRVHNQAQGPFSNPFMFPGQQPLSQNGIQEPAQVLGAQKAQAEEKQAPVAEPVKKEPAEVKEQDQLTTFVGKFSGAIQNVAATVVDAFANVGNSLSLIKKISAVATAALVAVAGYFMSPFIGALCVVSLIQTWGFYNIAGSNEAATTSMSNQFRRVAT